MAAKRKRGIPDNPWNAIKNASLSFDLTPVGKSLFKSKFRALGIKSVSDWVENFVRGQVEVRIRSPQIEIGKLMIDELDKRQWSVERLAEELDLDLSRVDKLLNYEPAEMHELIALQTILTKPDGSDYDIEDLIEINQRGRKANGEHQPVKCND